MSKPGQPKKLFEPITAEQIKRIQARVRLINMSDERLYAMVTGLTGLPSITSLSMPEAAHLIEQLHGRARRPWPDQPRFSTDISGDTATLPYFYHVMGIRLMIKELGWDKEHMKNWLVKYMKVPDIRSLNRRRAQAAFGALKNMQTRRLAAEATGRGKEHD